MTVRARLAATLLLFLFVALPAAAGFGQNVATQKWNTGKSAFDAGNYTGAIAIWTDPSVEKYASDEPTYFMWLGIAYANTGQFDKAATTAGRGLELKPTDVQALSNLHWVLAKALLGQKQYDRATVEAEASIAATPQDAASYLLLARIHSEAGRNEKAVTAATRSLELNATADGYSMLGLAHLYLGKPGAALQNFEKGVALDPKSANARLGLIVARSALLDFPAAEASAKRAVADGIPEAGAFEVAVLYYMGRYEEGLAKAEARLGEQERGGIGVRLGMAPQNGFVITEVLPGTAAEAAGLKADDWISEVDGQKTFKGALNIQPLMTLEQLSEKLRGEPGTTVTLKIYRPGKMTPIERTVTRKALVLKDSALDYGLRALLWRAKGDADKALADAQKAVSLDRTPFLAGCSFGFALLDKGQPDEALKAFDDPTLTPTMLPFAEAHRQVGKALCFAKKGELDKASDLFFAAADQLDPKVVPGWQDRAAFLALLKPIAQGHLDQAKKLEGQGQYAQCLAEYAQALRYADDKEAASVRASLFAAAGKMPTPPELPEEARRHSVRGELLVKVGDLAGARPEFAEAIRLAPYVPKLYFNAALLNAQLGRYADATHLMNTYLEAAPEAPDARAARDEIIKWELLAERQKGR